MFFVFSGSPAPALVPSSPLLHSHHLQDTKNTQHARVFHVQQLSCPSPRPQHENCAHKGLIFMLGHFSAAQHQERAHVGTSFVPGCLLALSPPPEHEKHATHRMFFMF